MVLGIERSKVKITGTGLITLRNDTSFQTAIALHSYSLGGDTDKSNSLRRGFDFELYEYIYILVQDD